MIAPTVCLAQPYPFGSIGEHYLDFHQVSDDEVLEALAAGKLVPPASPSLDPKV
jgi:predicted phosphoribosyltransferase